MGGVKLKSFCTAKQTVIKRRVGHQNRKIIFIGYRYDKRLISRMLQRMKTHIHTHTCARVNFGANEHTALKPPSPNKHEETPPQPSGN